MLDKDLLLVSEMILAMTKGVCQYADFRYVQIESERMATSSKIPEPIEKSLSAGYAVRVIKNGSWGFAASSKFDLDEYSRVVQMAIDIAEASSRVNDVKVELSEIPVYQDEYRTKIKTDPFSLSLKDKLDRLIFWEELIAKNSKITSSSSFMDFRRTTKFFRSLAGSQIKQEIIQTGAGITCGIVKSRRERYERSFPSSSGQFVTGGYEVIDTFGIEDTIERVTEEAVALTTAKECPSGETTIILSPDMASLQIHESIGHPLELDRVFGAERNFSGASFATPEKLDKLQYASEIVNVYSDPTYPGGLATYGYDDDGIKAARRPLIEKGILRGYLSSLETAARLGRKSTGANRADGWGNVPICRMTNIVVEPGDQRFSNMISEVDDGIYMETINSWSIDDYRETFRMGTEIGWEIKNGKLGEMIKAPTYSSSTVQFWNNCDSVGSKDEWVLWGTPNCGKGQPSQNGRTAQGAAYLRFRNVKVGT